MGSFVPKQGEFSVLGSRFWVLGSGFWVLEPEINHRGHRGT